MLMEGLVSFSHPYSPDSKPQWISLLKPSVNVTVSRKIGPRNRLDSFLDTCMIPHELFTHILLLDLSSRPQWASIVRALGGILSLCETAERLCGNLQVCKSVLPDPPRSLRLRYASLCTHFHPFVGLYPVTSYLFRVLPKVLSVKLY